MNLFVGDPFVIYDNNSKKFFCYSTNDDLNSLHPKHFSIHESDDGIKWKFVGYAYTEHKDSWAYDWFWAPEVYYNENNGYFYLFYSAKVKPELLMKYFNDEKFFEGCKIGVLISKDPRGPFIDLANEPIDFYPHDAKYFDPFKYSDNPFAIHENLYNKYKKNNGVYVPTIDVNLLFDENKIFMFLSRNAYKNLRFDVEYNRYIEESCTIGVELNTDWWYDKKAKTMPTIKDEFKHEQKGIRKDSYINVLNYENDKQSWENGSIFDFEVSKGKLTNRRWTEGTYCLAFNENGKKKYSLFYSSNNYQSVLYAIGVAFSDSPLGPYLKYEQNPIVHLSKEINILSTGHGSICKHDDDIFYYFHGREDIKDDRILCRARISKLSSGDVEVKDIIICSLIK